MGDGWVVAERCPVVWLTCSDCGVGVAASGVAPEETDGAGGGSVKGGWGEACATVGGSA